MICVSKHVKVDGKVRTDPNYPAGFMDVIEIPKSGDQFRLIFDTKGRFVLHRVSDEEKQFKLCRVKRQEVTKNKIPVIVTHDGRTIRFPHPDMKINDSVKLNLETGDIDSIVKLENGSSVFCTGGNNIGRVGILQHIEHHPGSFEIAHVKDARGNSFATRLNNIFCIGAGKDTLVSLPKQKGIRLSLVDERAAREKRFAAEDDE